MKNSILYVKKLLDDLMKDKWDYTEENFSKKVSVFFYSRGFVNIRFTGFEVSKISFKPNILF
jgi:hypothetical protein